MPSTPPQHTPTSEQSSHWLCPVLILSVTITLVAGMIYTQRLMQQVEHVEQTQVAQYESRSTLLAQPDALNINWMQTLNPIAKDIQGDIVWSTLMQQGMMRFANLPILPKGQQFHLWIHDLTSRASEPVSIVRFAPALSIPRELLIPFTSSQKINEPYKFTVTLEYSDPDKATEPLLLAQP